MQIAAMGCDVFEIGLFKPDAAEGEAIMVPRVWDREALVRSVPWLRHENLSARNIYVRPKGEHQLSLVDDLSPGAIANMAARGVKSRTARRLQENLCSSQLLIGVDRL